ncbi:(Fe-S)-binding protein [Vulcanisaeta thermophila]|uniref:(Fe-S)-binding protein n=1 Tax=Vulcanisaeta thermophila TaxID=867917 RepID=UPI0008538071|nr:(Fe-S)-binding protein [Vulcanisaeta thermophila]
MESWVKTLVSIIQGSLGSNGLPIPMDKSLCTQWAGELNVPKGGDTVIYTSCLYQMAPVINQMIPWIEKLQGSPLGGVARVFSRFSGLVAGFVVKPSPSDITRANGIVKNIAQSLRKSGINFGYLYEDEPYSGALLYELGAIDQFLDYFEKTVMPTFKRFGVRKVITIDPHTHNILTEVAPRYFKLDFDVVNYLDIISKARVKPLINLDTVVIHDSCLYARYLNKYDVYRSILDRAGIKHVEDPVITGRETSTCCGGPIESLNPGLSERIAKIRIRNLAKLSRNVVTLCPICLANLTRNNEGEVEIRDINEVITVE